MLQDRQYNNILGQHNNLLGQHNNILGQYKNKYMLFLLLEAINKVDHYYNSHF